MNLNLKWISSSKTIRRESKIIVGNFLVIQSYWIAFDPQRIVSNTIKPSIVAYDISFKQPDVLCSKYWYAKHWYVVQNTDLIEPKIANDEIVSFVCRGKILRQYYWPVHRLHTVHSKCLIQMLEASCFELWKRIIWFKTWVCLAKNVFFFRFSIDFVYQLTKSRVCSYIWFWSSPFDQKICCSYEKNEVNRNQQESGTSISIRSGKSHFELLIPQPLILFSQLSFCHTYPCSSTLSQSHYKWRFFIVRSMCWNQNELFGNDRFFTAILNRILFMLKYPKQKPYSTIYSQYVIDSRLFRNSFISSYFMVNFMSHRFIWYNNFTPIKCWFHFNAIKWSEWWWHFIFGMATNLDSPMRLFYTLLHVNDCFIM